MPIIKKNGTTNWTTNGTTIWTEEINDILRKINNKQYVHIYKETKTFNNWNAQLLTSTPEYTIQKNKLIRFNLRVPARSLTSSRWGLYIQINAKVNWTWYNFWNCGYDWAVMAYDSRDISTYIETKLYDFIWNLWLDINNTYTLQFEITCRTYSDSVTVNGSHEINQISGNLWSRWPVQDWASDQNYTTIIIEEIERY